MLQRSEALAAVTHARERARAHVGATLSDLDALTIALAAGTVEAEALIEYACEGDVRVDALRSRAALRMSDDDFVALFGAQPGQHQHPNHNHNHNGHASVAAYEATPEAKDARALLEAAMGTTLRETAQRTQWTRSAITRVAAFASLLRGEGAHVCLSAVAGGVVQTDVRSVEDLKTRIEDEGIDVMSVSHALRALARSVLNV